MYIIFLPFQSRIKISLLIPDDTLSITKYFTTGKSLLRDKIRSFTTSTSPNSVSETGSLQVSVVHERMLLRPCFRRRGLPDTSILKYT